MTRLRRLVWLCLGLAIPSLLAGCSYSYPFEVAGVVRSAATGKPLAGVEVYSTHINPDDPVPGEDRPVAVTGPDGSFSFAEKVSDVNFMQEGGTRWVLLFRKKGLKQERSDLRHVPRPRSARTTTPVAVAVSLSEEEAPR
jgi:hypothetical protein